MTLDERRTRLLHKTFLDYRQTTDFLDLPLIINRAEGLYYWDADGKRYFDGIGGIFVAVLGHGHPRVLDAMRRQMETLTFAPPLHSISDVALEFVETAGRDCAGRPELRQALQRRVGVHRSGAEVRPPVLASRAAIPTSTSSSVRYYGYHGGTFGAMAASGTGKRKIRVRTASGRLSQGLPAHLLPRPLRLVGGVQPLRAQAFEDVIVHEDPDTVAGVIVEPIGNTGGIITPTDEYFQMLRDICDRHNVLLIFDEIITGYGRTGNMFAAQTFGVTPDIICGGKGLSSGAMPLGAMIAREDMGDVFLGDPEAGVNFAHGHTFAGNPLACAVGLAVIDEIVESRAGREGAHAGRLPGGQAGGAQAARRGARGARQGHAARRGTGARHGIDAALPRAGQRAASAPRFRTA